MKSKHLLILLPAAAIAGVVFAQGPLTPPGAPAPLMKTLDQIEPRTPVSSLPFTISQSGSYYFTRNLQHTGGGYAITIEDSNVTLDLNGFTLSSSPAVAGTGIYVSNLTPQIRNVRIMETLESTPATTSRGVKCIIASPGGMEAWASEPAVRLSANARLRKTVAVASFAATAACPIVWPATTPATAATPVLARCITATPCPTAVTASPPDWVWRLSAMPRETTSRTTAARISSATAPPGPATTPRPEQPRETIFALTEL